MSEQKILPGAEAFFASGNHIGVLVIHGYTGSPQSMRYLAERLAQANYTVALPRLSGHGTTPAEMATTTASDWITDLHTALDWLKQQCDTFFVTGLSMGGTLALYRTSQAFAALSGRAYVIPDDVKHTARPVLSHRMIATSQSRLHGRVLEQIVEDVLHVVPVPVES